MTPWQALIWEADALSFIIDAIDRIFALSCFLTISSPWKTRAKRDGWRIRSGALLVIVYAAVVDCDSFDASAH